MENTVQDSSTKRKAATLEIKNLCQNICTGDKKKGLPRTVKLSNPNHETKQGYHGKYIYIGVMV